MGAVIGAEGHAVVGFQRNERLDQPPVGSQAELELADNLMRALVAAALKFGLSFRSREGRTDRPPARDRHRPRRRGRNSGSGIMVKS